MASPVRLILARMANVPVRLSRYSDDRRSAQSRVGVAASGPARGVGVGVGCVAWHDGNLKEPMRVLQIKLSPSDWLV
jgi:hypothetical protein